MEPSVRRKKANFWSLRRHHDVYALVLGSAIGIGNVMTVPLLVRNGGGLNVLVVHFLGIFLLGGSLLLAEFLWARWTLRPYFASFAVFGSRYRFIPYVSMLAIIVVTPPYLIELGKLASVFPKVLVSGGFTDLSTHSQHLGDKVWIYLASLGVLAFSLFSLLRGPRRSALLAKWSLGIAGFCLLAVAAAILHYWGVGGISKLLNWDMSAIAPSLVFETLTFSLFTLSAGFGIMCNYIFYASQPPLLNDDSSLSQLSLWQSRGALGRIVVVTVLCDFLASLLGIVLVSPFAFGPSPFFSNASLDSILFDWLPHVLVRLPNGFALVVALLGGLFFAGFAAFLSLCDFALFSIETELQWVRFRAAAHVFVLGGLLLLLPLKPLFAEWMGFFGMNILLPLSALGLSLAAGWKMSFEAQSRIFGKGLWLDQLLRLWRILIRFCIPAFLAFYLFEQIQTHVRPF